MICDQGIQDSGRCANAWCHRDDRKWGIVSAISTRTGELDRAIKRYKYDGRWAWATIFGRVIAGFLAEHATVMAEYTLMIPAPAYTGAGARRSWDHIDLMCAAAANESGHQWPMTYSASAWPEGAADRIASSRAAEPVLSVTADSGSMVKASGLAQRRLTSQRLYEVTTVTARSRVAGKRVLVMDDIFTSGSTLQAYARRLRESGALEVDGLVLARSSWG